LLIVSVQRVETGRWNAFFLVQSQWDHSLRDPLEGVADAWHRVGHGSLLQTYHAIGFQTLLVVVVFVCVAVELIVRRGPTTRFDALVLLLAIGTWLMAFSQRDMSVWRSEAALLPLALLVRRLPATLAVAITAAAFATMLALMRIYFRGYLI
jgi:hypothetical protein